MSITTMNHPQRTTIQIQGLDGDTTSEYTNIRLITKAGQSKIFQGISPEGEEVIIKVYKDEDLSDVDTIGKAQEGGFREVAFLKKALQDQRNDVPVFVDAGIINDTFDRPLALVTKPVQGKSLEDIIASPGHNPTAENILRLADSLAETLKYAHKGTGVNQVINRDLKPSNIIVQEDGSTVIVDWGGSKFGSGDTLLNTQFVSLYYTALEVENGRTVGTFTDVCGLGQVLKAYILGKKEFEAFDGKPMKQNFVNKNIPLQVIDALFTATEEEPNKRYKSIDEFVEALHGKGSALVKVESNLELRNKKTLDDATAIGTMVGVVAGGLSALVISAVGAHYTDVTSLTSYLLGFFSPVVGGASGAYLGRKYAHRKLKKLKAVQEETQSLAQTSHPQLAEHREIEPTPLLPERESTPRIHISGGDILGEARILSPQEYMFEPRSPREGDNKKLYTFDQSLARLKQAGYLRHPSPREAFSFIANGLENKLTAEQKGIFDDMLQSYGEWMDMAGQRQGDTLTLYSGIDGLVWNSAQNKYDSQNFSFAEKKEFDIAGKKSREWIDIKKFDDALVQHVYGRLFAQLPKEMRKGGQRAQVYLPADGVLWPVGRGVDYRFNICIVNYYYRASRGVASGVRPQGAR